MTVACELDFGMKLVNHSTVKGSELSRAGIGIIAFQPRKYTFAQCLLGISIYVRRFILIQTTGTFWCATIHDRNNEDIDS